jgi:AraC-type transcriptional regulator
MPMFSVDLPVIGRVTRASQAKPYLGLWLKSRLLQGGRPGDEGVF